MTDKPRWFQTTAIDYPNSRPHIGTAFEKLGAGPDGARLLVSPGQRMIGGETVMAELDPVVAGPRTAVEF